MSIYATTYWLEGNRGNYGPPEEPWAVHLATARHWGDKGLIRVSVNDRMGRQDETVALAFLDPAEARELAAALVSAAEECERAWPVAPDG